MALTRTDILNILIKKNGYKSYLEIGVNTPKQPGYNWSGLVCDLKHGVDPNLDTTFRMTSDEFFAQNKNTYDLIFIDGLHIYEQVYKDVMNALEILNEGGTIMMHDCNPLEEITQRRERASDVWHGDCWKAFVQLRLNPNLTMYTIDADEGCGIIQKGKSEPFELLDKTRKDLLNLISAEQWIKSISSQGTDSSLGKRKTTFEVSETNGRKICDTIREYGNPYPLKENMSTNSMNPYRLPFLLSIAIPCYEMHGRGVEFLDFSLNKIYHQTYKNIEVVISDHSQDDGIEKLCKERSVSLDIKYFRNKNRRGNSSANLNNAIINCTGDLIKILFQDDFLFSEKSIEEIVDMFIQNPQSNWLVTACEHSNDGVIFNRPFYPRYNNDIYFGNNTISSPSVLTIRNKNVLLFDENLVWLMDCDYYKRLYVKFGSPLLLNQINVVNRTWDCQFSNLINDEIKKKEYTYIKEKYGIKHLAPTQEMKGTEEIDALNSLQRDFRNVPELLRLAEIELQRSNQKKARNYLVAAKALDPENEQIKHLWEKLKY